MKLYDDGKTGIALEPHFVETHAGNLHVYEDRTQAGDIVFITTDNFKKYIPIEWINNWLNTGRNAKYFIPMMELIKEWEKENETNRQR